MAHGSKPAGEMTTRPRIKRTKIEERVKSLAGLMYLDYKDIMGSDTPPVFLVMMDGAMFFAAMLLASLGANSQQHETFDYCSVISKSYNGDHAGDPKLHGPGAHRMRLAIPGRHVILIDDTVETGRTVVETIHWLEQFQPLSVRIAALLIKRGRLAFPLVTNYWGFDIDFRAVGLGMDYKGSFRHFSNVREAYHRTDKRPLHDPVIIDPTLRSHPLRPQASERPFTSPSPETPPEQPSRS